MNDSKAHEKLKEINRQRNVIGVGGYRNSKRDKNERHEKFCKMMNEVEATSDKIKLDGEAYIGTC